MALQSESNQEDTMQICDEASSWVCHLATAITFGQLRGEWGGRIGEERQMTKQSCCWRLLLLFVFGANSIV